MCFIEHQPQGSMSVVAHAMSTLFMHTQCLYCSCTRNGYTVLAHALPILSLRTQCLDCLCTCHAYTALAYTMPTNAMPTSLANLVACSSSHNCSEYLDSRLCLINLNDAQVLQHKFGMADREIAWLGVKWQPWYQELMTMAGITGDFAS